MAHHILDLAARALVQQRHARAGTGRVAGSPHIFKGTIRDHPQHHRIFRVDMGAKGTRQHHPVNRCQLHLVHQQAKAGMERRLGKLDRPHIILGHDDIVRYAVGKGPAIDLNARAARRHRAVDNAITCQDFGEIHLGQHLNNAGPANAGDPRCLHRFVKSVLIRPLFRTNHPKARLQRILVDTDAFNCPRGSALAR